MTNKEKYGDEIIELATNTAVFGLKNGKPAICEEIKCEECDFYESDSCKGSAYNFREWLNSGYVEPPVDWSKVAEQLEAYSNADEAERLGTMPVVELADAIKIVKGGGVDG